MTNELPVIECHNRTPQGTCRIVDNKVGAMIPMHFTACLYCIKTVPVEKHRGKSRPVKDGIARGKREDAKKVERIIAPVVADPQARLEICETECDKWINGRCKASCNCKTRPRPLADDGKDCPLRKWKR
jgi:hypothetical protein